MEIFDLIEFQSYVTPWSERYRTSEDFSRATERSKPAEVALGAPLALSSGLHSVHRDWKGNPSQIMGTSEDIDIESSDFVHFHVHRTYLLAVSTNMFNGLLFLPNPNGFNARDDHGYQHNVVNLPESGAVVNLLLSAAYSKTPAASDATDSDVSLSDLQLAVVALKTYGIPMQSGVFESPLWCHAFASHCPTSPLQVYAVAASHAPDLHALAVYASQFLLSFDLSTITDEMAVRLGAFYLHKLFSLHLERVQEFKRLIDYPPSPHGPLPHCNDTTGRALNKAWAFAMACLSWAASPDLSNSRIDDVITAVLDKISCHECRVLLRDRVRILKQDWSSVKTTI